MTPGIKRAIRRGWSESDLAEGDIAVVFARNDLNVALKCGGDRHLVDIDIDSAEALALSGVWLPSTPMARRPRVAAPQSQV